MPTDVFEHIAAFNLLRDNVGTIAISEPASAGLGLMTIKPTEPNREDFIVQFDGSALFGALNELRRLVEHLPKYFQDQICVDLEDPAEFITDGAIVKAIPSAKLNQAIAAARSAITANKKKNEILIRSLGDDRWGLFRDGVAVFTAHTMQECEARANVLYGHRGLDRGAQDAALGRLK